MPLSLCPFLVVGITFQAFRSPGRPRMSAVIIAFEHRDSVREGSRTKLIEYVCKVSSEVTPRS
jgi:hypothetical protein